jgi:hypothetical protein
MVLKAPGLATNPLPTGRRAHPSFSAWATRVAKDALATSKLACFSVLPRSTFLFASVVVKRLPATVGQPSGEQG